MRAPWCLFQKAYHAVISLHMHPAFSGLCRIS